MRATQGGGRVPAKSVPQQLRRAHQGASTTNPLGGRSGAQEASLVPPRQGQGRDGQEPGGPVGPQPQLLGNLEQVTLLFESNFSISKGCEVDSLAFPFFLVPGLRSVPAGEWAQERGKEGLGALQRSRPGRPEAGRPPQAADTSKKEGLGWECRGCCGVCNVTSSNSCWKSLGLMQPRLRRIWGQKGQ